MKRIAYLFVLFPIMFGCKKHISPAPKLWQDCYLQYSTAKWLSIGDSIVVADCFRVGGIPVCQPNDKLDSISFTRITPDISGNCCPYEVRFLQRSTNKIRSLPLRDLILYDYGDMAVAIKIEKVLLGKILFKIWYNHTSWK